MKYLFRADEVRPGMMIDLEGDKYYDPDNTEVLVQYQYMFVSEVERETDNCIALYGADFGCGFPVDHMIPVKVEGPKGKAA